MVIRRIVRLLRSAERGIVVVEHQPTGNYLGVGLLLVGRDAAIEFADIAAATRFLDLHGSEPSFRAVLVPAEVSQAA